MGMLRRELGTLLEHSGLRRKGPGSTARGRGQSEAGRKFSTVIALGWTGEWARPF